MDRRAFVEGPLTDCLRAADCGVRKVRLSQDGRRVRLLFEDGAYEDYEAGGATPAEITQGMALRAIFRGKERKP